MARKARVEFAGAVYHLLDLAIVCEYIARQDEHHRTRTFQEEYLETLQRSGVAYDERYLW